MKNFGMYERKQYMSGRPSPRGEYPLFIREIFRIKSPHAGKERRGSSNRDYRRQRSLSDRRIARRQRIQRRYAIWGTFGRPYWRKDQRSPGLFSAATRTRSPNFAARNQSQGQ